MNFRHLILVALALCLCFVLPVSAVGAYYESKYVETSNLPYYQYGWLSGSIRAHVTDFSNEIGVRDDMNPDGVNGSFDFYPINSDGTFEIQLLPGSYTLYIKDGNGGQPEYSHAKVVAGRISNPETDLLGHAVTPSTIALPVKEIKAITICSAVYIPNEFKCTIKDGNKCSVVSWGSTVVTSRVQSLVNSMSSFTVSNDVLGRDPAYGWQKRLDVIYVNDGGSCKHLKDLKFASAPEWTDYSSGTHGIINFN